MRQVQGYMTAAGEFFEHLEDAEFAEAEDALQEKITNSLFFDTTPTPLFLEIIRAYSTETIRYAFAYQAMKALQEKEDARRTASIHDDASEAEVERDTPSGFNGRDHTENTDGQGENDDSEDFPY